LDQRLLTPENVARLFERAECVRIRPGPQAAGGDAGLARRLHVPVQPAFLFLDGDTNVIHRQYAKLYPAYLPSGAAMDTWPEALLGLDDLLALVGHVETLRRTQEAQIASLREVQTTEARVELARLLRERGRPEDARAVLEKALVAGEDAGLRAELALLEEEVGRFDAAHGHVEALLRSRPDAPDAPGWRLTSARLRLEQVIQDGAPRLAPSPEQAAALAEVRKLAASEAPAALVVGARLLLARAAQIWKGDLEEHLRWLGPRTGDGERAAPGWSPLMLRQLVEMEQGQDVALRQEAARHARQLVATFPDSVDAQRIKHGSLAVPRVSSPTSPR